jgi:hypothetical protein
MTGISTLFDKINYNSLQILYKQAALKESTKYHVTCHIKKIMLSCLST